uniref:Signal recognition particle receptor alpha subunit N-terminal domain-containing protein n=1 Tax=Polytomella parva TaxID=51329 RepID=A0A7S0VHA4_9CHLO|mmetsp:Transcript_33226/g.60058  ORF Transcript_33226/g.60058 Transcript_33226/m.60058 type:complete len:336 (+) Transcript_33226:85-1092(+)
MLDYFAVFSRGGILLWALQFAAGRHSPVEALNCLVKSCLLEERSGENTFTFTPASGSPQALKWTFHNGLGLVFVAVYQKALTLSYVDDLLKHVKEDFAAIYKPNTYGYKEFDHHFMKLMKDVESQANSQKRSLPARPAPQEAAPATKKNDQQKTNSQGGRKKGASATEDDESAYNTQTSGTDALSDAQTTADESDRPSKAFEVSRLPRGIRGRGAGSRHRPDASSSAAESKGDKSDTSKLTKPKKAPRVWDKSGGGKSRGVEREERLDFTEDGPDGSDAVVKSGAGVVATGGGSSSQRGGDGQIPSTTSFGESRMDEEEVYDDDDEEEDEDEGAL